MACRCSESTDDVKCTARCDVGGGVKLFGVRIGDGTILKKSASMGNLTCAAVSSSHDTIVAHVSDGYLSDNPANATCSTNRRGNRKKAIAWTGEEHRLFLKGLQKIGKGDWRGIAKNFVISRTPTQVASHAQKYFFRHSNLNRRKKRSSLFDMVPDAAMDTEPVTKEHLSLPLQVRETGNTNAPPSLNHSLNSMKPPYQTPVCFEQIVHPPSNVPPLVHTFIYAGYYPVGFPLWPQVTVHTQEEKVDTVTSRHQVLKSINAMPREPVNVDKQQASLSLTR